MHRQKGTPNIPQTVKDEIVRKQREGMSVRELAREYRRVHIWLERHGIHHDPRRSVILLCRVAGNDYPPEGLL